MMKWEMKGSHRDLHLVRRTEEGHEKSTHKSVVGRGSRELNL